MSSDELSPLKQAFVREHVRLGGTNATQAAIAAGYSAGGKTKGAGAAVTAHRLLRDPRILAAIRAEVERTLRAGVALGANVLVDLATKAQSEDVRFKAAQALLDRGGMQLATLSQHHVVIEDKRSDAELLARIAELQRDPDIRALSARDATDAVLVAPQPEKAAAGCMGGLLEPDDDA